jgi:putative ATPase
MRDLFDAAGDRMKPEDPLADRMRPQVLTDIVGQEQIIGEGRLLRQLIEADRVPSLILWGPPGTGKTTLAQVIAKTTRARFVAISAVLSGVAELRAHLEEAKRARGEHNERTILFVDEIHRWSKSQQDALLGAVEKGTVTLIGATTENPSFELNSALLSRTRVFVLEAIEEEDLLKLLERALADKERGLGNENVVADPEALHTIAAGAYGDARRALNTLEVAAKDAKLVGSAISPAIAEEALQHRALLYDKAGDAHYGVISAFIKSMRGSDPDAAVYYMTRMLESGEDPRFILRRMVIFASEDVGNADPIALSVAVNALHAFELVGLPEGVLPMSQAVTYLACAEKSNASYVAYNAAKRDVQKYGPLPVPKKLLPAPTGLAKKMGHGKGYQYPHDTGGFVPGETYLPDELIGRAYYEPKEIGAERAIAERLRTLRESVPDPEDD